MQPWSISGCAGALFTHRADWSVGCANPTTCAALEPLALAGRFRANIVLTVVNNGSMTFGRWQARTDRLLPIMLDGYEVIDLERLAVCGRPGGRRMARHRAPCGLVVVFNQWFVSIDGVGITLTGTVDAPSFPLFNPAFERAAASLTISPTALDSSAPA
ncbi:MAG: hypothetical protein WA880_12665 [Ornithinimicrobium sp.]